MTEPSVGIDWYAEMRDCVGEASELADRVGATDTDVGETLSRLCNVVTHLLDENKALANRLTALETSGWRWRRKLTTHRRYALTCCTCIVRGYFAFTDFHESKR
jgi:hypothetical protein